MKAIVISSLLFFSLRAMSATVGLETKTDCPFIMSANRDAKPKIVIDATNDDNQQMPVVKTKSK